MIENYQVRDYQVRGVEANLEYFTGNNKFHALAVYPTGAGKSHVIAQTADRLGEPLLILQPSREILAQNHSKFLATGNEASIYSASFNSKVVSKVTFATIGSIVKKPELFKHFKYFIVDEAHAVNPKGGMYSDFFAQMEGRVLGLTATPYRLSTTSFGAMLKFLTRTRPKLFSELIYWVQVKDLVDQGYLTSLTYYDIAGFDRDKIRLNSTRADYDDRSLTSYMEEIKFIPRLEQVVGRLLDIRNNMVVFTKYTKEAHHLAKVFPDKVQVVSAKTSDAQRDELIKGWQMGQIHTLANVGVLDTGVDYQKLETVVLASPTRSLSRYYQKSGRASRINPDKKDAWLVDMCGNMQTFGKVEDLHLGKDKKGLWQITTNGRPLTNVNF